MTTLNDTKKMIRYRINTSSENLCKLAHDEDEWILADFDNNAKNKFHWENENDVLDCTKCKLKFNILWRRKHHCRFCGKVFCSECCKNYKLIPQKYVKKLLDLPKRTMVNRLATARKLNILTQNPLGNGGGKLTLTGVGELSKIIT